MLTQKNILEYEGEVVATGVCTLGTVPKGLEKPKEMKISGRSKKTSRLKHLK